MTVKPFLFYNRPAYFAELTKRVSKTKRGDRVAIISMTFDSTVPQIAALVQALCEAAQRGVHVLFSIDAYTFLTREGKWSPGPLWYHRQLPRGLPEPYRQWKRDFEKLKTSGVHCTLTNLPAHRFSVIPKGRSHIKGAVINDDYLVGGCNLDQPTDADIMVGQTNPIIANWLFTWIEKIVASSSTKQTFDSQDRILDIDDSLKLIIDSGAMRQSAIYEHALQLIDEAREWIFLTCQFFPGGTTASHLYAAYQRGVALKIIFSHPYAHGHHAIMHQAYNLTQRLQLPVQFFADERPKDAPLLHAKILATDAGSIVGSHNYVEQGVVFGTAEIALWNRDASFSKALMNTINTEL